jgi:hypothetical protein
MTVALAPQPLQLRPEHELSVPQPVVRRLEGTERLTAIGNAVHDGNFNVVGCVEIHGPVTHALLQRALEDVQRRYECLQVEVVREVGTRDQYVFRHTHERPRLTFSHEDWRVVWQQLCDEVVHGLAWRAVWTQGRLLVLFHHAITDAGSQVTFYDQVLQSMARSSSGVLELRPSGPIAIPPPLHRFVGSRWPKRALWRIGAHRLFGGLTTGPLVAAEPRARRWAAAFRTYEPDETQALLKRCRENGLTLTHALSASATLELQRRVGKKRFTAALCTSVDLRRLRPEVPDVMGQLSSAVHSFFPMSGGETLWPLAAEAKRQLGQALQYDEHRDMPLMHTLLGPRLAAHLESENEGRTRDCTLLLSNAGRLGELTYGAFRAQSVFFTGSQPAFGSMYLLVAASVRDRLCLHLGFPTPTLSIDEGESALDRIVERLLA